MRSSYIILSICSVAFACAKAPLKSDDTSGATSPGPGPVVPATQQSAWAAIQKLEQEARSIAKTNGCTSTSDCRAAPVGSRGCGGPRYYLPYCSRTTDSTALFRKLDEIAVAEKAYNIKYQIASTCELRMPPAVEAVGGICTAR